MSSKTTSSCSLNLIIFRCNSLFPTFASRIINLKYFQKMAFFPTNTKILTWTACLVLFKFRDLTANHFNKEPNLAQLLDTVENCDLQIIHNGRHQSDFAHFRFLPTTMFDLSTVSEFPEMFNVFKVKVAKFRIICVLLHSQGVNPFHLINGRIYFGVYDRVVLNYLTFRIGPLQYELRFCSISTAKSIFPLIFSNKMELLRLSTTRNHGWCPVFRHG